MLSPNASIGDLVCYLCFNEPYSRLNLREWHILKKQKIATRASWSHISLSFSHELLTILAILVNRYFSVIGYYFLDHSWVRPWKHHLFPSQPLFHCACLGVQRDKIHCRCLAGIRLVLSIIRNMLPRRISFTLTLTIGTKKHPFHLVTLAWFASAVRSVPSF